MVSIRGEGLDFNPDKEGSAFELFEAIMKGVDRDLRKAQVYRSNFQKKSIFRLVGLGIGISQRGG